MSQHQLDNLEITQEMYQNSKDDIINEKNILRIA